MLTPQSRERDFPTLRGMAYLNTAAEGVPPLAVRAALEQYFADHQLGMDGRERHFAQWEAARALTAEFFGLSAGEVSICSSSSEAYNLAALALRLKPGDEVVINDLDFPAGATPWLQESCPATPRLWKARDGGLRIDDLVPLLGPRTRLVAVSMVSFFNGFRLHVPAVLEAVRRHSPALLAVDVTQALGRDPAIPRDLAGVDLIVSSTHKWILASHGGGLVGVPGQRAAELTAPAGGWFHLQDAFGPQRFERAVSKPGAASFTVGMPNFPGVYAIRAALDYVRGVGVAAIDAAARPLVLECLRELRRLPVEMLTPDEPDAVCGILAFRHSRADEVHRRLRERGVHIMHHAGRLRVAIHGYNTATDVAALLRELREALPRAESTPAQRAAEDGRGRGAGGRAAAPSAAAVPAASGASPGSPGDSPMQETQLIRFLDHDSGDGVIVNLAHVIRVRRTQLPHEAAEGIASETRLVTVITTHDAGGDTHNYILGDPDGLAIWEFFWARADPMGIRA